MNVESEVTLVQSFSANEAISGHTVENGTWIRVRPTDTGTFSMVIMTILLVAAVACGVPAWRAARVDPIVALRYE